jgi:hypothetical protein
MLVLFMENQGSELSGLSEVSKSHLCYLISNVTTPLWVYTPGSHVGESEVE